MDAILYIRVSSPKKIRPKDGEDDFRQRPEIQEERLRAYCEKKGWKVVAVYCDRTKIPSKERPEFKRLLEEAQKKKPDVLVVASFDRFACSLWQFLSGIGELNRLGLQFVSLPESVDTTTNQGKLLFALVSAMARMEAFFHGERTAAGVSYSSKPIGRPKLPVDLPRMKEMDAEGIRREEIARQMKLSVSYVNKLLAGSVRRLQRRKPPSGAGGAS